MDPSIVPEPARETEIFENISEVLEIVKNKSSKNARLVLVSKTKPSSDIIAALKTNQLHFGENYIPNEIRWHYIGRLQSNKCKILANIPNLWAVETIDSAEKAKKMNDAWSAAGHGRPLNIFVQVNTSSEPNKGGVEPEILESACISIKETCPDLNLLGLMTIGSVESSGMIPNPDFLKMLKLRDECSKALGYELELSMGMSNDYEHALEVGSNNVRVGSKIFGSRTPKQ
ncbi:UPF0001 protein [Smittium culicis]|uniref:Pyridoxal phosphate homeostasis protein n=1 Tax=Smittium culicis TaxID=133412 RepID=A0A1R1XXU5_9FUNG|nr:UPF0001 protein [Smittium culicis]